MTLRFTLSSLSKRVKREVTTKCLDKGNHNPPIARFMKLLNVVLLVIGLMSL